LSAEKEATILLCVTLSNTVDWFSNFFYRHTQLYICTLTHSTWNLKRAAIWHVYCQQWSVISTIKKYTLELFPECTGVSNVMKVGMKKMKTKSI